MVNVLGVAFERRNGEVGSSAHQAFALLDSEQWQPMAGTFRMLVAPCRWWGAAEFVLEHAADTDAIVLFGARQGRRTATVARFARNLANRKIDNAGYKWPGAVLAPGQPSALPATLSSERLARAMELAGLPARTAHGDRYVYNHCFYRLLSTEAPPTALVRLPMSLETGRCVGERGFVNRMQIVAGVAAAISFAAAAGEPPRGKLPSPSEGAVA